MKCLHPKTIEYINAVGIRRYMSVPCGHCIACLHNLQDSWCIRLQETSKAHKTFIYDTLTFKDESLPTKQVGFFDKSLDNLSEDSLRILDDNYLVYDSDSGEMYYNVPLLDKTNIQNWVKRGRENFYNDNGYRLKMKYFVCSEYGPKTSRPHYHVLFFGIDKPTYDKYFAKPWQDNFGFTKTKHITTDKFKDRQCISRYVSKYVSKGVFESPLVKDGISNKPFRLISKGIGEEYLKNKVFDFFKSDICQKWKRVTNELENRPVFEIYAGCKISRLKFVESISPQLETFLNSYVDSNGFRHSLPRYYLNKLLGYEQNFLKFAVQEHLLFMRTTQQKADMEEFARKRGFKKTYFKPYYDSVFEGEVRTDAPASLMHEYFAEQRREAQVRARAEYTKLKNHYKRGFNLSIS